MLIASSFFCDNNTGSLVNSVFRVDIFNPFSSLTLFDNVVDGALSYFTSSPSSGVKSSSYSSSPDFSLYHSLQSFSSSVKLAGSFEVYVTSFSIRKIIVFIQICS